MVSVMLTGTVMYLCSSSSIEIHEGISKVFGGFATPPHTVSPKLMRLGRLWASDNGCFTRKFDAKVFFGFLKRAQGYQSTNLFVACPDVVADGQSTLRWYKMYHKKIRDLGYTPALVTQDGMRITWRYIYAGDEQVHLSEVDWLFIGGTDNHKFSTEVVRMIRMARTHGIGVHIGRVNSRKRLKYFMNLGAHTVDGTHVNFEPKKALRDIERWITE